MLDPEGLQQLIDEGYIGVHKHPDADLWIYNYTHKTQYDKMWNKQTIACRGIITDGDGRIVARPFKKFFNFEETPDLPAEPFEVYDKLDGSLGILYWIKDEPFIATRGSFVGEQAIKGTELLRKAVPKEMLPRNITLLFEIIYPENRIVVKYKEEKLVLLAAIDTHSGIEIDPRGLGLPFETAKKYDFRGKLGELAANQEGNREGYVVKFRSGLRVKIKFAEYKRLHRLLTGVNPKHIWEILSTTGDLDSFLGGVPDEFFQWVMDVRQQLLKQFNEILNTATSDALTASLNAQGQRKGFALYATKCKYPSVMFRLFDQQDPASLIWKLIKPRGDLTFKIDIDA